MAKDLEVAIVFADVVGSTQLYDKFGEDMGQNYEYYDEGYQEDFDANQVYNDFFEGLNMQANRQYVWPFSLFFGPS